MKNFAVSSEEEMVFEFLKSESRWFDQKIQDLYLDKFVNEIESNQIRQNLLGQSRGFKNDERIFYCYPNK